MPEKHGHMPLQLQVHVLRRNLLRYNSVIADPDIIPSGGIYGDDEWQNYLEDMTLPDNIRELEKIYPSVQWRKPRKEPGPPRERRTIRWKVSSNQENDTVTYTTEVKIQPQKFKSKGKTYLKGRIQLIVNDYWIGSTAKISLIRPKIKWKTQSSKRQSRKHKKERIVDHSETHKPK